MKKILCIMVGLAAASAAMPAQESRGGSAARAPGPADSLYRAGRAAIDAGDYRRAATALKQLIDRYGSSDRAGDALYWRAWSLYQLGSSNRNKTDLDAALAAIDRYNANYGKNGQMAGDATDLHARIRAAQARLGDAAAAGDITKRADDLRQSGCSGSTADQETRMAALEGLLSMNSDDAIPILTDVLKQRDACRAELRKRAVFLISQKSGPDLVRTLLDVARNDPSTEVRGEAIFWLSQARSEQAVPALDSVLFSSKDEDIRKKAIFALSQQRGDVARQALRRAAEDEHMPDEIRGEAVFWLGQSGLADLDFFKTLFKSTKSQDIRSRILNAVATSNVPQSTTWLLDLARDKSFDTETRKSAIFWASQRRALNLDALSGIYAENKGDDEIQRQVLFVLSQRNESAAVDKLMDVAKSDPDIEMRKQALFWLGQKNDPRVRQFLRDLINK
jgi:HEAT repeat protein